VSPRDSIIGCCLLLAACGSATTGHLTGSGATIPSSAALPSSASPTLEQVPAELSVAHFAAMRLEGTDLTFTGVLDDNDAYTRHAITYRSNGLTISGIMNIPKGDGAFPLVIFAHGYIDPSVYTQGRGLKREQDFLARQGFAVLHTDYRGFAASDPSPDVREVYDAGLEYSMDAVNAVNAVRNAKLAQVDAQHVGILGHSLGGGVALNIAVARPDLADAFVLYAPVHSDAWENFSRWRSKRDDKDRTPAVLGTREENPAAWDALSSLTYLKNITAPVLLFQGTADADVPPAWSDDLNAQLEELHKDITYVSYEDEKHEFIPRWEDFMKRITAFLRENLMKVQ
jgi:dipeptidyl aminopeptidase/acylaminoacyl peptidase